MKTILLLIFAIGPFAVFSQKIVVGEQSCTYTEVNKCFSPGGSAQFSGNTLEVSIDIDRDGVDDINFVGSDSWAGSYSESSTSFGSLDSLEFIMDTIVQPNTIPSNQVYLKKSMHIGDTIDASKPWWSQYKTYNQWYRSYIRYRRTQGMYYTNFSMENPTYLGFRKIIPNDTIYGWILTRNDTIKSYAYKYASGNLPPGFCSFEKNQSTVCYGNSLVLKAAPSGGVFSGANVTGNVFSPGSAGTYTVNYVLNKDSVCSANISKEITVVPNCYFVNTPTVTCATSKLILQAVPSGAVFTGTNVTNNEFLPPSAGNYTITATYSYGDGCVSVAKHIIKVNPCVGIEELENNEISYKIFPNPNSGSFEVSGTKEETLYVFNELGICMDTILLDRHNNFSEKIDNYKNGVYFIGNKYSKKKVVVIN